MLEMEILFIMVSGVLLGGFVGPQPVAAVSFLLVLIGCLIGGFSGFVWVSHFIFLSFLGGMLVLFLYSTALAPCPGKLTLFRPGMGVKEVFWYMVGVSVFWCVGSGWADKGIGGQGWQVKVSASEISGSYEDFVLLGGSELIDFGWLGGWFFPWMGLVLFLCMVSVTKLCGKVTISLRRVGGGSEVLRSTKKLASGRGPVSSLGRLQYAYTGMEEITLRRQG